MTISARMSLPHAAIILILNVATTSSLIQRVPLCPVPTFCHTYFAICNLTKLKITQVWCCSHYSHPYLSQNTFHCSVRVIYLAPSTPSPSSKYSGAPVNWAVRAAICVCLITTVQYRPLIALPLISASSSLTGRLIKPEQTTPGLLCAPCGWRHASFMNGKLRLSKLI